MPTDIEIGAGYCGDALFQRFPGQYRDPEMDSQAKAHFDSFPGNHGPVYTDPDVGRRMVMKEIPGVGQVVVPVDHTMAQVVNVEHTMAGMAAVYPVDHTMVGLNDDPKTDHGRLQWHHTLVLALDQSAHMTNSSQQLSVAFNDVAQKVVQRALKKAQAGKFASVTAAVQFVKDAITASAGNFTAQVQKVAVLIAASASKAAESALSKVWTAPKAAKGVGDWPGSMMGGGMAGWGADIWNILTGKSQAWYTRLSNIQDYLNITLAGVTAVGKDKWNLVSQGSSGPSFDNTPVSGVDDYDTVVGDLQSNLTAIIVTQNYVPSDAVIAAAQAAGDKYNAELSTVQQSIPDVSVQVQADQAKTAAGLPAPMASPAAVGQQVFVDTVAARAKGLVDTGTSLLTYVGIGAGVVVAYVAAKELHLI